jgi:hypothetical protein
MMKNISPSHTLIRLTNIWQTMFSTEPFIDFSTEQYPMLIGIQRLCQKEKDGFLSTKYQFQSLLRGDTLARTQEKSTRAVLLGELRTFKKECNDNELALVGLRTLIITYFCCFIKRQFTYFVLVIGFYHQNWSLLGCDS